MSRGPKVDKAWAGAIRQVVMEHQDGDPKKPRRLRRLAENLVKAAEGGDMSALVEIGNRLDGRPHQSTTIEATIEHRGDQELLDELRHVVTEAGLSISLDDFTDPAAARH